jgi:hypothetical protein
MAAGRNLFVINWRAVNASMGQAHEAPSTAPSTFHEKSAMTTPAKPEAAKRAKDNERPLVEDIRLLGRILGDVIREQEGPPLLS